MSTSPTLAQRSPERASGWFHKKYGWIAEKYYTSDEQIELCQAILANDLVGIERAVANGADVNARGKGGMTPLLWAYAENNPERLKKLLVLGADPNATWQSDFNTRRTIVRPGDAVTSMVCDCSFNHYFDYVFDHGGNPNLVTNARGKTPIVILITGMAKEKRRKLKRLIELGADIEDSGPARTRSPARIAVTNGYYDLALELLRAGADYRKCQPDHPSRLIHGLAASPLAFNADGNGPKRAAFRELVGWLEARGETLAEAAKDRSRWREWLKQGLDVYNTKVRREAKKYLAMLKEERLQAKELEVVPPEKSIREDGQAGNP